MENYKTIPKFKDYKISTIGNIKSVKFNKEIDKNIPICSDKYKMVSLYKDGKRYVFSVHQLMGIVYLNHKPDGGKTIIHHKNNIKTDNRLSNLEEISKRNNTYTHNTGKSKYRGVGCIKSTGKWSSRIWDGKKRRYLGAFINEHDAHLAYEKELSAILLK